ncbi:FGGY family carbohydrate kinase [Escherichia coli]
MVTRSAMLSGYLRAVLKQEVIAGIDCGATNVRAIAVNGQGKIVARASTPNARAISRSKTTPGTSGLSTPFCNALLIAVGKINSELTECHIRRYRRHHLWCGWRLVDKQGNLLYPIISWKCPRTAAVMDNIEQLISAQRLQAISGVGAFSFNTFISWCG